MREPPRRSQSPARRDPGPAAQARRAPGPLRRRGPGPGRIEVTTTTIFEPGSDPKAGARALLGHLEELAAVGVDHAIVGPVAPWDDETLDAVAGIVAEAHEIRPETPADAVTPHA